MTAFSHLPTEQILASLGANPKEGLSDKEAGDRLKKNHPLQLKKFSSLRLFLSQFHNPLIYLLLFASVVALILYDKTDSVLIFAIVLISALLSFFQERGAAKTMEELIKVVKVRATVIRGGGRKEVLLYEVVPGDIIELNAGDLIPGDCILLESKDLLKISAA